MSNRCALLVGINDYGESLNSLCFAEADATQLAEVLRALCGFQTQTLLGSQATRSNIIHALEAYRDRSLELFLFFFAGHGELLRGCGTHCLHCHGSRVGDTVDTLPLSDWALRIRAEIGAQSTVMIVDACRDQMYGRASPRGASPGLDASVRAVLKEVADRRDVQPQERAGRVRRRLSVLLSCSAGQVSYEDKELKHGVFTHALIEEIGERGNKLPLDRLRKNIGEKTLAWSESHFGAEQVPEWIETSLPGEVWLRPEERCEQEGAGLSADALKLLGRAEVFEERREFLEAKKTLEKAVSLAPRDPGVASKISEALSRVRSRLEEQHKPWITLANAQGVHYYPATPGDQIIILGDNRKRTQYQRWASHLSTPGQTSIVTNPRPSREDQGVYTSCQIKPGTGIPQLKSAGTASPPPSSVESPKVTSLPDSSGGHPMPLKEIMARLEKSSISHPTPAPASAPPAIAPRTPAVAQGRESTQRSRLGSRGVWVSVAAAILGLSVEVLVWLSPHYHRNAEPVSIAAGGWQTGWFNGGKPTGARRVDIMGDTLSMRDYRLEFECQIDKPTAGWVFRASDLKNFYVEKIRILKPGPEPSLALVRFAVVDGKEERRTQLPLAPKVELSTTYRVRTDIVGTRFTTWIQDRKVDEWTDARFSSGGVGLYYDPGDFACLKSPCSLMSVQ